MIEVLTSKHFLTIPRYNSASKDSLNNSKYNPTFSFFSSCPNTNTMKIGPCKLIFFSLKSAWPVRFCLSSPCLIFVTPNGKMCTYVMASNGNVGKTPTNKNSFHVSLRTRKASTRDSYNILRILRGHITSVIERSLTTN